MCSGACPSRACQSLQFVSESRCSQALIIDHLGSLSASAICKHLLGLLASFVEHKDREILENNETERNERPRVRVRERDRELQDN